jgi:hypothetical protein
MHGAHLAKLDYPVIRAPGRESAGRTRVGFANVCVPDIRGKKLKDTFCGFRIGSKKRRQRPPIFFPIAVNACDISLLGPFFFV